MKRRFIQEYSFRGAGITFALVALVADGALGATPSGYDFAAYATGTGCGAITLSGNASTDSFDSSQGSYSQTKQLAKGFIGTNGNVTLIGNVIVNGPVFALNTTVGACQNGSPGITVSGNAKATGGYLQLGAAPTFPNPAPVTAGSQDYNITSDTTLAPGSYGNITQSGKKTLTLSPGTYSVNSLTLSGGATLAINPAGQVLIDIAGNNGSQPFQMTGGSQVNPSGIPSHLQLIYGGSSPITLSGGGSVYAGLYAPNALVTVSGNLDWYGAVVVSTLNDSGDGAFHYDRSLAIPPTITGLSAPTPNPAGWNNSNVTVNFTCMDVIVGIASCSSPVPVTTEGADQIITGTAVNREGVSSSVSVTINLDKTPPTVAINSPATGISVNTPSLLVTGTATDALSGVASAICQGAAATLTASNFSCTVSLVPGTNTITVQATDKAGNTATATITVTLSTLTITDFNPKSAPAGTLVNVAGNGFVPTPGAVPKLTLSGQGGATLAPPLTSFNNTALAFVIPAGAATGPLTVAVNGKSAVSASSLTVTPPSNFTLTALPPNANLIEGQSVSYSVQIASTNGFNQLALLSVTGVPSGIIASFNPASITAGQTSVFTLTASSNQAVTTATLNVAASATVSGLPVTQSAPVLVSVVAPTTTLLGRTVVSDSLETPLAGVTIKTLGLDGNGNNTGCTGHAVTSDAAGNFLLTNLPMQCIGPQLISFDGTSATAPSGKYAGVNLVFTLTSGQVTASPVLVHLPRIDNVETFLVTQNSPSNQTHAFTSIPGLSVTVYAGTTFTMPDGTQPNPFPLAAVQVPVDRLPDAKPNVPTMIRSFIVAFQPANATTNEPVAVNFPNTLNTPPGTDMALMTLDPTHGTMVPYGTGAVSADGTEIVPDPDPAHPGHLYGLVHFDWHGPMPPPSNNINPGGGSGTGNGNGGSCGGTGGGDCNTCPCIAQNPQAAEPVDLASGLQIIRATDIAFAGSRGRVAIERIYRSASNIDGPFGLGTQHTYNYLLDTGNPSNLSAGVINLITPDNNRFPFNRQADGTLINTTIPNLQGAVMRTPSGGTTTLRYKNGVIATFQSDGLFTSREMAIADPNGNQTTIVRGNPDNLQQVTAVTDPVGRQLTFTYASSASPHITSITDPIGRAVTYTYNPSGTLATVTDPAGGLTKYFYDANNQMVSMTDARGVTMFQNTYANGRVVQQQEADGGVFNFEYTFANVTIPEQSPILATIVRDPLNGGVLYRFDPQGFVIQATTLDPSVVNAAADSNSGEIRVFARMPGSHLVLGGSGPAKCAVCGNSQNGDFSFMFDASGNMIARSDALGDTTAFTYDPLFTRTTSIRDPLGNTTRFTYDSRGNLITETDANGNVTGYQYDLNGELAIATDALGQQTHFTYDGFGNLVSVMDPLGNITAYVYDAISRLIQTNDALGRRTTFGYDALGRLVTQTDAKNGVTRFAYDPVGNLLSVTDARGNATVFTYDSMNRLLTRTDSLGRSDQRQHDFNGNLVQYTDRRGVTSRFNYDFLNRLVTETYVDATVARSYDANGRLLQVNDSASGVFTFSYDAAGRLVNSATPIGTVQYTSDALGRAISRQVVGQAALSYSYDAAGNLTSAALPQASASFTYTPRNQLASINRLNGVSTAFSYDSDARLLSLTHAKGASVIDAEGYSYDPIGNRLSHSTSVGQPLITSAVGNVFNADNQLTQAGTVVNTFDGNGNLAQQGASLTYTWDGRNRLKSIVGSAGQTTTFTYDFAGNLITQSDSGSSLNLTKSFVLDDLTNIAFETASDGTSYSVLSGQSIDSHLAIAVSAGQVQLVQYGLTDAINSTVATADQTGAIQSQFLYEPFGQTTTTSSYPFQFTGRMPVSADTDYYRARYYSSASDRFIAEDRLSNHTDANAYTYAGNSPQLLSDPLGLDWQISIGLNALLGLGNPLALFVGGFVTTGINVGGTSSGTIFVQAQAGLGPSVGAYAGGSVQGGLTNSATSFPIGLSGTVQPFGTLTTMFGGLTVTPGGGSYSSPGGLGVLLGEGYYSQGL